MKELTYIIVSEKEGVYDDIVKHINESRQDGDIRKADTVEEGISILERGRGGIIITDLDGAEVFADLRSIIPSRRTFFRREPGADEDETRRGEGSADMSGLKHYIRMHLEDDLNLTGLSQLACLSPNYLSALFKKTEGISMKRFIERSRMDRAAYLLATEDSQTSEIARRVGYSHCSYFCKVFRKYHNTTPLQYRKNARNERRKGVRN